MKNVIVRIMLSAIFMYAVPLWAQEKTVSISGKVTSFEESLPLEGVSIAVKGSNNSTGTQADGTFTIVVSSGEKLLQVSLAGYEKKEIALTNAQNYDIVLKRLNNISAGERADMTVASAKQNEMLK